MVSVPYRGATFLNGQEDLHVQLRQVSVPYRGATFLNIPQGFHPALSLSFRPLSGSYISQLGIGT